MMDPNLSKEDMEKAALAHDEVKSVIGDRDIVKVICVPGRLINLILK